MTIKSTCTIVSIAAPLLVMAEVHYGPPKEIFLAIQIGLSIVVILAPILLSKLIKKLLEKRRQEQRKHIWFQSLLAAIMAVIFIYIQNNVDWITDALTFDSLGDEYFPSAYTLGIIGLIFMAFGSFLGYFITPKKH